MATRRPALEVAQQAEKKGAFPKAAEAYLEHLSKHADDLRAWLRLAEIQERLGQLAEAATSFRRHGELNIKEGFGAKGVASLRRSLKLVPHEYDAVNMLSDVLAGSGKNRDAVEVLELGAAAAAAKSDLPMRVTFLKKAATLDGTIRTELALAEVLADAPDKAEAIALLSRVAGKLKEAKALSDQIRVQERLLELSVKDITVALEAAEGALALREPIRALLIVRRALDGHPDDIRLLEIAGNGLAANGDNVRATQAYREMARRLGRTNDVAKAREAWFSVLRYSPEDAEAKRVLFPKLATDTVVAPTIVPDRIEVSPLKDIGADEADMALSALEEFDLDLAGEAIGMGALRVDPVPPSAFDVAPLPQVDLMTAEPTPVPDMEMAPSVSTRPSMPRPERSVIILDAASPEPIAKPSTAQKAMFRRALVLGNDADAAWVGSSLNDLGVEVETLGADELGLAIVRASTTSRDLVFAPSALVEDLASAGGAWQVVGLFTLDRSRAVDRARAGGLPVVRATPIRTAEDLDGAFRDWGAPLELHGAGSERMVLSSGAGAAFQLTIARKKLGMELYAQRPLDARSHVVLVGDGREARALGQYMPVEIADGVPAFISGLPSEDKAVLKLAEQIARAMSLKGVAVMSLGTDGMVFGFESFATAFGPGTLAVEARLGVSVVGMALEIARGGPLPAAVEPRGVACAVDVATDSVTVTANLRVEKGLEGRAYVCSSAADEQQATRRLTRALKIAPLSAR